MVTVFFYLHIFTESVGRRIVLVVPVDTLYKTSIISSSTVLLLNLFANLSLAPLSLFSIYGPDLGVWPDCWVSAEFLRAPIPRKGSGSTTTTTIFGRKLVGSFSPGWLFFLWSSSAQLSMRGRLNLDGGTRPPTI